LGGCVQGRKQYCTCSVTFQRTSARSSHNRHRSEHNRSSWTAVACSRAARQTSTFPSMAPINSILLYTSSTSSSSSSLSSCRSKRRRLANDFNRCTAPSTSSLHFRSSERHEFVDRKQATGATTLLRGGSCIDRTGVFSQQRVHYIQGFVVHASPMQGQPWLAIGYCHGKYKCPWTVPQQ
jgi:hypothetical protein